MSKLNTIFLVFVTILSVFLSVSSFLVKTSLPGQIFRILLIPTTLYLTIRLTTHITSGTPVFDSGSNLMKILVFYCLIVSCTVVLAGIMSSHSQQQFFSSLIFAPLAGYFLVSIWPRRNLATSYRPTPPIPSTRLDEDKRDFLKMVGAAGLSVLLLNIFSRKTVDVPFLNTALSPNKPDPDVTPQTPKDSPTSGFYISQIDDSEPAYFGFTNKMGQWYIMREESDNAYRYSKGDRDFTSNWTNRAALKYDYFENVF